MELSPEGGLQSHPAGWNRYSSGCYLFVTPSRNWDAAVTFCKRLGASLTSIRSPSEYRLLQHWTRSEGYYTSWIGGSYYRGWRWLDGSLFSYQNWYSQLSVTYNPCVYLNTGRGWSNSRCSIARPFICQKRSC
uniref:C-type lectin domain-containing protein n=2 Tax=Cynoglossus semilaevis TaxID=244447 RepID=A0A3P8UN75_CYNSE